MVIVIINVSESIAGITNMNESAGASGSVLCWYGSSLSVISSPFVQVSVGYTYSCAIGTGGTPICTSSGNSYEDLGGGPPAGVALRKITTSSYYGCGLRASDGAPLCWGSNTVGQSSPPALTGARDIASGVQHSCALDSQGRAHCWGWGTSGQTAAPATAGFTSIAAGTYHSCALNGQTGAVSCWGCQPDQGSPIDAGQCSVPANTAFLAISAGVSSTCGIVKSSGAIRCWGARASNTPSGTGFRAVSVGMIYSAAIGADGTITRWNAQSSDVFAPPPGDFFLDVASGVASDQVCSIHGQPPASPSALPSPSSSAKPSPSSSAKPSPSSSAKPSASSSPSPQPLSQKVTLKWPVSNKYLAANSAAAGYSVSADRVAADTWEEWTVTRLANGKSTFKSFHGRYLCAEQDGRVVADRTAVGNWEQFDLVIVPNNGLILKTFHGTYVTSDAGGVVRATTDSAAIWNKNAAS